MAGAGYKLFNTGDVLTAAQVNTYLNEQTVMVFASSAARTSALSGVLAEGMMSYLQDTNAVEVYNGTSWVNVGNAGDITEVQAGVGISIASGTGPIPVITNDMATTITASGDIVVGTGSGTYDNLPIGTTGQVLTADTTVSPYKVKWATASGGGKILQVVQGFKDDTFTLSSETFTDVTNLSVSITPTSASSKILVLLQMNLTGGAGVNQAFYRLMRGSTAINIGATAGSRIPVTGIAYNGEADVYESVNAVYLDSPATTGATTYKIQVRRNAASGTVYVNRAGTDTDTATLSRGASSIVVMEVGA